MPRFRERFYSRVQRLVETKVAVTGHKTAGEMVHRVFKRVQGYSIVEIHQNHSHIVDMKYLPGVRVTPIVIAQIRGSNINIKMNKKHINQKQNFTKFLGAPLGA